MAKAPPNLIGQRFGRLIVVEKAPYITMASGKRRTTWLCQCDCGKQKKLSSGALLGGHTNSCGCYRREWASKSSRRHGKTGTREYIIWVGIIARCYNEKADCYPRYGGRGIKMCKRWRESFENFLADMGKRPSRFYSIERRDNNGDYTPENCHWATAVEQGNNKRDTHYLTFQGETMSMTQMWRKFAFNMVSLPAFSARILAGWTTEDAINIPQVKAGYRRTGEPMNAYANSCKKEHSENPL